MAAANPVRIIRAPGRLVAEPVDLRTVFPYGGVELGNTKSVVLQNLGTSFRVENEALGEAVDILEANTRWIAGLFLRGFDDDALSFLMSDYAETGANTGHTHLVIPNRGIPGASGLRRARKLLYVPDDVVNSPAILIYRGIADMQDGAEISFQRGEELGIPIAIECLRGDSGKILEIGRLADLPVTP